MSTYLGPPQGSGPNVPIEFDVGYVLVPLACESEPDPGVGT
jgi:hypothetical protein